VLNHGNPTPELINVLLTDPPAFMLAQSKFININFKSVGKKTRLAENNFEFKKNGEHGMIHTGDCFDGWMDSSFYPS